MHSNINVHHHKNLNSITVQTPATSFVSTNENYCHELSNSRMTTITPYTITTITKI